MKNRRTFALAFTKRRLKIAAQQARNEELSYLKL